MGPLVYLKDVVTLRLVENKCTGCGTCLMVCPQAVLARSNSKVTIVNRDACIECGACSKNCPVDAVTVRAGVGCAAAVINSALGRKKSSSCCAVDSEEKSPCPSEAPPSNRSGCC